jgi:hypothetical protein
VFNITGRNATVHATIVNPGSTGIIASGICWSTTPYPSFGNSHTTDGTSIGAFLSTATTLTSGTTFYVRAYATNAGGTAYGIPISFTTPTHCGSVTDYDGNVYNTVYIGAQCWMKENLKTTHYSMGQQLWQELMEVIMINIILDTIMIMPIWLSTDSYTHGRRP